MSNNPNTKGRPKDTGLMFTHAEGVDAVFEDNPVILRPL
jgi:hypothetical protein